MNDQNSQRRIRSASTADWPVVQSLLQAAGLPVEDLDASALSRFLLETKNAVGSETIEGAAGLEIYGSVGLLRSLVVDVLSRGRGCGSRLVDAVEQMAGEAGIRELWLLTIDADRFFASRGYRAVLRDTAPPAIRGTAEFSGLCPDSAVLMTKSLA